MNAGPLDHIRVLDLSRLIAGNMLTMLLADFGADVIKVEHPRVGDTLRGWRTGDRALYWEVYGRNKRSITLDLKSGLGRDLLLRLAGTADVLVESFRPGALARMGFDVDTLHSRNPRLVIVSISGWGLTGSLATKPGFGTLVEARSGFAAANGFPDREPVLPPLALADMVAGIYGAYAASIATRHAETTGRGQMIDLSLFEALFSIMGPVAAVYETTGQVPMRCGSRSPTSAPRNIYATRDRLWVALSATTQAMFERLAEAIGRRDLVADPLYRTNTARLAHIDELDKILTAYFGARTRDAALDELDAAGVTVCAVDDISTLIDGDFFTSRNVLTRARDHDGHSGAAMHNVVPRLSATPGAVRTPAPKLGQHNHEILRPLVSADEWDKLTAIHA